jgi:Concanavalin A-like lectin/glucanases superfamily
VRHRWQWTVAVVAGALLLGACGGSGSDSPGASAHEAPLTKVLSLDFEQAAAPLGDGATIRSALPEGPGAEVDVAGPGKQPLRLVSGRDDRGHGVAFPAPCPASPKPTCPKAIIEVAPDPALNPGTEEYEWGASVLLEADETSEGSNILQKGFSVGGGSQWKLQVDGKNGHPSCVVVGEGDAKIHEVYGDSTIADGKWHDVACRRDGGELMISIDGAKKKEVAIPKSLAISPVGPVRIGGKSLKPNNDQYFGTLDDVFVAAAR